MVTTCLDATHYKTVRSYFPEKQPITKRTSAGAILVPVANLRNYKRLCPRLPAQFSLPVKSSYDGKKALTTRQFMGET